MGAYSGRSQSDPCYNEVTRLPQSNEVVFLRLLGGIRLSHFALRAGAAPVARPGGMERFIARENIKRFKQQLETCTDEVQRLTLEKLLAAEEAKLEALTLSIRD